jgi:AGCS family alanine or glycine:cation symporter
MYYFDLESISNFNRLLATPVTFLFWGVALFLTIKLRFIQIRAFPRFLKLLRNPSRLNATEQPDNLNSGNLNSVTHKNNAKKVSGEISPLQALFTAMSTTIGVGNIVSPSLAIIAGGPGALFWMIMYSVMASATKYTEVLFAIKTREETPDGHILGGPTQYLKLIHPWLAKWYGFITIFLFAGWSGLQSNALAEILQEESVNKWVTGTLLAILVLIVLWGGAKRVGSLASKLVPIKFSLYIIFALMILLQDLGALKQALILIIKGVFTPQAFIGGGLGAAIFTAIRVGTYKSAFVSEAGVGTSSIPHALANVRHPKDQAIMALYSIAADTFLVIVSGLIVLVTGVWSSNSEMTGKLVYLAFKYHSPFLIGRWVLLVSISMFVFTTVMGNSFNGAQSFASFTKHRGVHIYHLFVALVTLFSAVCSVPLIWHMLEVMLSLVVIPNLIGLVFLAQRHFNLIEYKPEE